MFFFKSIRAYASLKFCISKHPRGTFPTGVPTQKKPKIGKIKRSILVFPKKGSIFVILLLELRLGKYITLR